MAVAPEDEPCFAISNTFGGLLREYAFGAGDLSLKEPVEEIAYRSDLFRRCCGFSYPLVSHSRPWRCSHGLTLTVVPLIPVFLIARQHFRKRLARVLTPSAGPIAWSNSCKNIHSAIPNPVLGQENRQERRAFQLLGRLPGPN